jgi:hypothetical protein
MSDLRRARVQCLLIHGLANSLFSRNRRLSILMSICRTTGSILLTFRAQASRLFQIRRSRFPQDAPPTTHYQARSRLLESILPTKLPPNDLASLSPAFTCSSRFRAMFLRTTITGPFVLLNELFETSLQTLLQNAEYKRRRSLTPYGIFPVFLLGIPLVVDNVDT